MHTGFSSTGGRPTAHGAFGTTTRKHEATSFRVLSRGGHVGFGFDPAQPVHHERREGSGLVPTLVPGASGTTTRRNPTSPGNPVAAGNWATIREGHQLIGMIDGKVMDWAWNTSTFGCGIMTRTHCGCATRKSGCIGTFNVLTKGPGSLESMLLR